MTENIITPNFTNGLTIVVMAAIFFTGLYLIAQGAHWVLAMQNGGGQS